MKTAWNRISVLLRMPRFQFLAIFGLLLGFVYWFFLGDVPTLERLILEATPLVDQLDAFKEEHGYYPDSLEEAGLVSPHTKFGEFNYYKFHNRDGSAHYGLNICVPWYSEWLDWDSSSRSWGTDSRILGDGELNWSEAEVRKDCSSRRLSE